MFKCIVIFFVAVIVSNSEASYHVATYNTENLDTNLPTRVMVAGNGDDLGLLFEEVAKAKALKYAENYPQDQIVLIAIREKELGSEWELKRLGFKIIKNEKETLDGKEFIKIVTQFKKIISLDIFSHSSAQFGIHLDGRAHRLNITTEDLETLKGNFIKDAFAYLHGCNTGYKLAPFLSNLWGIPVAGSMTSTNFQKLHSNGNFYLTEEGYAPNSDWAEQNTLSNNVVSPCSNGTCLRLKPDNTPYVGFWGAYRDGGLPFYKFFCVKNASEDCLRVMAKSMLSHTLIVNLKNTSSLDEYKKGVFDFLCPVSSKKDLRGECESKLEEALLTNDMTYNPFSRPQVECDFKECKVEISCKKLLFSGLPKPGTCELKNNATSPATTLVREYKAYLQAFEYLKH